MSKATKKSTKTTTNKKGKTVAFSTVRQAYAKRKGIDVTKASKQLRAKIRGHYGKDPVVTKWMDRHNKAKGDGNRYGDMTTAEAKHIAAL
jgi:hypothetical protein